MFIPRLAVSVIHSGSKVICYTETVIEAKAYKEIPFSLARRHDGATAPVMALKRIPSSFWRLECYSKFKFMYCW